MYSELDREDLNILLRGYRKHMRDLIDDLMLHKNKNMGVIIMKIKVLCEKSEHILKELQERANDEV